MGQWSSNQPTTVANRATIVAQSTYGERVCAFLAARHPHKTAECVGATLRCAPATIRKMLERRSAPSFALGLRMFDVYGPEFAAAVLPGCGWMSDAATRERRKRIDAQISVLTDQRARLCDGEGGA